MTSLGPIQSIFFYDFNKIYKNQEILNEILKCNLNSAPVS